MSSHIANASAIALAGSDTSTAVEVAAPSDARVRVEEWGASFSGVTAGDTPILVELVRFTATGTGTAITLANMEVDPTGETFAGTAKHTITVEGAGATVLDSVYVHPNGGSVRLQPPEPVLVAPSAAVGVRLTTGTVTTGSAQASIAFTV
jgi:hypothetical protein